MSTEFIIGTIIGLIGLIPLFFQFVKWVKKKTQSSRLDD